VSKACHEGGATPALEVAWAERVGPLPSRYIDHPLKMGGLRVSKQRDSPWKNHDHLLMRRN